MRDEADQANYVCETMLEEREAGTALKEQAVLFRASHHSGPLEIELTRRNIPFVKFGGLKFLDAAHVKDVLAVLRFAENPRDRVAGFRVLQLLPGIGPVDGGAASSTAMASVARRGDRPRRATGRRSAPRTTGRRSSRCLPACAARSAHGRPTSSGCGSGTSRISSASTRTPRCAAPTCLQLEQIAAGYPSRERFLTELTLDPPDATSDQAGPPHLDEDYLILSTIHSAKGQEWKNVFVLNAVDGCIPSDLGVGTKDDIEEERRLLYVAMTRAKDALHLVMPQRFYHARPGRARRPPRLRLAHPLHPGLVSWTNSSERLAAGARPAAGPAASPACASTSARACAARGNSQRRSSLGQESAQLGQRLRRVGLGKEMAAGDARPSTLPAQSRQIPSGPPASSYH